MKKTGKLKKEIIDRETGKLIQKYRNDPVGSFTEVVRGVLKDSTSGYALIRDMGFISLGVIKGVIHGRGFNELLREMEEKRAKGEVINYLDEDWGRDVFSELLIALEQEGIPTSERLEIMRALLIAALDKSSDDRRRRIARELIKVAITLTSIEVLILKIVFENGNDMKREQNGEINYHEWRNWLVEQLGAELGGVVIPAIERLQEIYVLEKPNSRDMFVGEMAGRAGLTKTGMALMNYIKDYGGEEAE